MNRSILGSLAIVIFCVQSYAQKGQVIEQVIGVVGEEVVLRSELETQWVEVRSQGFLANVENSKCVVLEDILYNKLLLNQARVDSIIVEDAEVESEMERRLEYFVAQIGSESALEEYFKKSMDVIKDELRENLKKQLTTQRMQSTINENVRVTPSEVKEYFKSLPEDSLPLINTEVEVSQIVFMAPVSREEKDIARQKLLELRERIIKGEDFSTLAILYSEDPGTAKSGGELGLVGRAEVDPAFGAVAYKLKGNEVSRIVESQFGLHIIQLIERKGEKINVRHILIKPKISGSDIARARAKADSVLNLLQTIDTLSFEEAAYQFSEDKESKNNGGKVVNPATGAAYFELDQLEPGLYYAIEKLEEGQVSPPVAYKTMDGSQGYRLVKLNRKTLAHRANLKQDYQRINQIALSKKRSEKARKWTAETIQHTHIRISDGFSDCKFVNPWVKKEISN